VRGTRGGDGRGGPASASRGSRPSRTHACSLSTCRTRSPTTSSTGCRSQARCGRTAARPCRGCCATTPARADRPPTGAGPRGSSRGSASAPSRGCSPSRPSASAGGWPPGCSPANDRSRRRPSTLGTPQPGRPRTTRPCRGRTGSRHRPRSRCRTTSGSPWSSPTPSSAGRSTSGPPGATTGHPRRTDLADAARDASVGRVRGPDPAVPGAARR